MQPPLNTYPGQVIDSQLLRRSTASGSSTALVIVGPTKVKVCKSVLFTEGTSEAKIRSFRGHLIIMASLGLNTINSYHSAMVISH